VQVPAKAQSQKPHVACSRWAMRHKPDFGGKSETIVSPSHRQRQHRPEGPNPIAQQNKPTNAAQAWLRNGAALTEPDVGRRHAA